MSSSSLPPLRLEFARTPLGDALVALILTITIAVPTYAVANYGVTVVAAIVFASAMLAAYLHWQAGWLGQKKRVTSAIWDSEGRWWLTSGHVHRAPAALCPQSVATTAGAWLIFNTEQGRRYVFVARCKFPRLYRELLVRLRIERVTLASSASSDAAHVRAHFPLSWANFRRLGRSTKALMELPWPRATRGETRRP